MNDDILMHYGMPRRSGRFPFGSGEDPYQHPYRYHPRDVKGESNAYKNDPYLLLTEYDKLKNEGKDEKQRAEALGMSIAEMRREYSAATNYKKAALKSQAIRLHEEKGWSYTHIGQELGLPDTTIGNWCKEKGKKQETISTTVADILKKNVDEKGYIDIGSGAELQMEDLLREGGKDIGVSKDRLRTAVQMCEKEGYVLHEIHVEQVTNKGNYTNMLLLCPPGTEKGDIWKNLDNVHSLTEKISSDGKTVIDLKDPQSIDSSRVYIRYAEDGGKAKDGTIELRRGVDDISLGGSSYAQVRIGVDGTHYMKGMAFYSDDIPEGYDIIYNSNKPRGSSKDKVFKEMKRDPETGEIIKENPFGAVIKANGQYLYPDPNGKYVNEYGEKSSLSVCNKLKEEGDWEHYSKSLASQFLSKQSQQLIERQLDMTYDDRKSEFDDILALENKEVRNKLLKDFAENCDAAATHLKAAALPRQSTKVLLPLTTLKDNEIYAPTYKDGEHVVLVRYPHEGTFEIPELIVNNKNREGANVVGHKSIDAVGISAAAASKLSGADFDGDTALVIPANGPNSKVKITTSTLEGLEGFETGIYEKYEGMKVLPKSRIGTEMGIISNLITDMTLQGASPDELERATKHAMVIIDAHKHELNYKLSEEENGIAALHKKYQGKEGGGAATLISRASSKPAIPEIQKGEWITDPETGEKKFKKQYKPDPETGEWHYAETGATYPKYVRSKKNGKEYFVREDGTLDEKIVKGEKYKLHDEPKLTRNMSKMSLTKDAYDLISTARTPQEIAYANYANKMKALANAARKEYVNDDKAEPVDLEAKKKYAVEVASLKSKLNDALKNAPRERKAQIIASDRVNKYRTPDMDKDDLKKLKEQSMVIARQQAGANKKDVQVQITDREWEAIQAHAISGTTLRHILDNTDMDAVKKRATPKGREINVPAAKISRMKAMSQNGYTLQEIAEAMGYSAKTIAEYI